MASEPSNVELHDEVKTVTIQIFTSHEAAGLAAANLKAHGIPCWIKSDDGGGVMPYLTAPSGVRLSVRASDTEAAIALLNTQSSPAEIYQIETEAIASAPPENVPLKKLSLWQILSGIVLGVILCLFYQWASDFGTKTYYHYTNGKADEEWIYHNGHRFEYLEDRNLDGAWDHWVYYNEYGQVSRSEYDNNFDGKSDEWWVYSNGALVKMEKDTDFNGVPDEFCTYKKGIIQQVDFRPNDEKFTTQRWLYQNGVLVEILRGGDNKGHFKEDVKYDPFFNPLPIGYNSVSTNIIPFQLLTPLK